MADDFLPRGDQKFCAWIKHFLQGTCRGSRGEPGAHLGLRKGQLEQLQALRGMHAELENALATQMQLQRQAVAARVSKDKLRRQCETTVRELARTLQRSFTMTDSVRSDLGLRVRKAPISFAASAQPPATTPRLRVQSLPLRHLLHFVDEQTPTRKRKPPRVAGCQIACQRPAGGGTRARARGKQGAASKAENWDFLAFCSSTPQVVLYTPAEVGQVVRYRCRWMTPRGGLGPWSNTVTALVND